MQIYHHAYIYIIYNYTTCNSTISTITQISSLELNTISSPMAYTHNYIPYNCDIILLQEVHALTYPFPHKSSHSFHQFHALTYPLLQDVFWSISHKPGTVFTIPKQSKWAVHGQPTPPTSVPLGGTEFPWPFPASYTQKTI